MRGIKNILINCIRLCKYEILQLFITNTDVNCSFGNKYINENKYNLSGINNNSQIQIIQYENVLISSSSQITI